MEEEIWKDVVGYEGLYKVSNFGNITSCDREKVSSTGNRFTVKGKLLSPNIQKCDGNYVRYRVNLYKNKSVKTYKLHRLIAQAFIPNNDNKPQVNHIDNNPLNNRVDNLEWVTNYENVQWCTKQGRLNRGENNPASRLKESDIVNILKLNGTVSNSELQKMYTISSSHLKDIVTRKIWKHIQV